MTGTLEKVTIIKISRIISLFGNNNVALVAVITVALALGMDTYFAKQFLFSQTATAESNNAYTIISIICIVGQYLILAFVGYKSQGVLRKIRKLRITYFAVIIAQNAIAALFVAMLVQVHLISSYSSSIASSASLIAYSLAFTLIVYLAHLFFSWFKINRHRVILLYGLSSASICISLAIEIILIGISISVLPTEVHSTAAWFRPGLVRGSVGMTNFLIMAHLVSTIVSFIITWIATAILLRHYSQKVGTIPYWFIMSLPLLYFLSQFLTLFTEQILPLGNPVSSVILLALLSSLSRPIGGAVFGIAFFDTSTRVKDEAVRGYMLTSAFGLTLLFISSQLFGTALPIPPFPPFGFAAILFTGLSSYLVLVGIYSSAISVSHDRKLRKSMRREATKEARLLESMGWAQMEHEIVEKVMTTTKENQHIMTEETGIRPSLGDDELKRYLEDVMKELKAGRDKGKLNNDL